MALPVPVVDHYELPSHASVVAALQEHGVGSDGGEGLLFTLRHLVHTLVQQRPEDPLRFLAQQLNRAGGVLATRAAVAGSAFE